MTGKEKCKILKQLRKEIADNNDINYVVEECPHKGECKGTCPKCEAEVKYLEQELTKRHKAGVVVALAGTMTLPLMLASCNNPNSNESNYEIGGIATPYELEIDSCTTESTTTTTTESTTPSTTVVEKIYNGGL